MNITNLRSVLYQHPNFQRIVLRFTRFVRPRSGSCRKLDDGLQDDHWILDIGIWILQWNWISALLISLIRSRSTYPLGAGACINGLDCLPLQRQLIWSREPAIYLWRSFSDAERTKSHTEVFPVVSAVLLLNQCPKCPDSNMDWSRKVQATELHRGVRRVCPLVHALIWVLIWCHELRRN